MKKKDAIIKLRRSGLRNCEIARRMNVSKQYVSHVYQKATNGGGRNSTLEKSGYLTVGGVSRLLGVNQATVRRWSDGGKIPCFRINLGRRDRRFRLVDILELAVTNGVSKERGSPYETDSAETESVSKGELTE